MLDFNLIITFPLEISSAAIYIIKPSVGAIQPQQLVKPDTIAVNA